MQLFFFGGWLGLLRTLVTGILAYVVLIAFLRLSGKRTLTKMNAFDLVVTVALGSTLATILLSKDVPLAQGALAFAILIGLQFLVTWSSLKTEWVRKIVTGEPTLLLHRGEFLPESLRRERVTEGEIRAAARGAGLADLGEAEAIILETDGSFSVIPRGRGPGDSALKGMKIPGGPKEKTA